MTESVWKAEEHLSAGLVCSSAGQFAASPPTAGPCRRCAPGAAAPGGTHLPTEINTRGRCQARANSRQRTTERLGVPTSSSVAISIAVGAI